MAANAVRRSALDSFRSEWVRGSLDYQRAVDALDAARQSVEQARAVAGAAPDDESARHARETAEHARQRLAEIEAALERQFNEFCGVSE
jgi:exonuclease VII small subunit